MVVHAYYYVPVLAHDSWTSAGDCVTMIVEQSMGRYQLKRLRDTPPEMLRDKRLQRKLANRLRQRLCHILNDRAKTGSAVKDLGCSLGGLVEYLQERFQPGMTWANHGVGDGHWSIDHIAPLSAFDLTDRHQLLQVCHYTNLRPMWFKDNASKGNRTPRMLTSVLMDRATGQSFAEQVLGPCPT